MADDTTEDTTEEQEDTEQKDTERTTTDHSPEAAQVGTSDGDGESG